MGVFFPRSLSHLRLQSALLVGLGTSVVPNSPSSSLCPSFVRWAYLKGLFQPK